MNLPIQEIYNQQVERVEREKRDFWTQSLAKWQATIQNAPNSPQGYIESARCLSKLEQHTEAHQILEQGLSSVPSEDSYQLHIWLIRLLEECNRTNEAIARARRAAKIFSNDYSLKLVEALALPVIYDSTDEIEECRDRFTQGLRTLRQALSLGTPEEKKNALKAIASHSNFRLAYQAGNDSELQKDYGELFQRIMAANFPDLMMPLPMPEIPPDGKLRIGYVSFRFRNLSASKYFSGWIREHNKSDFSVYAYHVGPKTDSITEEVRKSCHVFRHISNSLAEISRAILNDRLHILVFLDVGLETTTTQLAALRLAPVQCAAWDQPVTTGLPTIDYFISSALAEPPNAEEHYSEKLVRLPGVGTCYSKPVIPATLLKKNRSDFQLNEDAAVYLCIQYAYKYLPGQDRLFVQIAKQVPNAKFVFLVESDLIAADLQRRLDRTFSSANLRASDFCVLLPALERFTYWNLSLLGDVFLDAIGWSGGVSTFEAIACRIPIVTLPGEFMRGRQSYAILTQLGVTDTIARNVEDYVEIAVRLGTDRQFREEVVRKMRDNYSLLFSDTRCVGALESFYQQTVQERLQEQRDSGINSVRK